MLEHRQHALAVPGVEAALKNTSTLPRPITLLRRLLRRMPASASRRTRTVFHTAASLTMRKSSEPERHVARGALLRAACRMRPAIQAAVGPSDAPTGSSAHYPDPAEAIRRQRPDTQRGAAQRWGGGRLSTLGGGIGGRWRGGCGGLPPGPGPHGGGPPPGTGPGTGCATALRDGPTNVTNNVASTACDYPFTPFLSASFVFNGIVQECSDND
jgi:hypothetical protein